MSFDNGIIDLRSDTVTKPTAAMRQCMAQAEVGDDVYGEDATVNRLEEMAAEKLGKEAALFVPSGTMGNLIAVLTHCQRGDEAIMGNLGHTFLHEVGGISALGGVFAHLLPNQPDGQLVLSDIRNAFREPDIHHPVSRLVILENTQNQCGGIPLTFEYMNAAGDLIHKLDMKLHLDGARIFNAAIALDVPAYRLASTADSVMCCLSKGLCAPVGSMLCGSNDFIARARHIRKMLGGGMRQVGILAAAGIVALNSMIDRLEEDHRKAERIAQSLAGIEGLEFDKGFPRTNMIFIQLASGVQITPQQVSDDLKKKGILVGQCGPRNFRLVTHYWVSEEDISQLISGFKEIFE